MSATGGRARFAEAWDGRTRARLPAPTPAIAAAVVAVGLALCLTAGPLPLGLVHLLQLGLAGAAAFLLDDAVAELTGVVPPPLWRRRAARVGAGLTVIGCAWLVVLVPAPAASRSALTLEVVVLVALAMAASSVVVRRGEPEPGTAVAPVVVLTGVAVMLAGYMFAFDAFPSGHGSDGTVLDAAWVTVGVAAVVQLVLATRDPAR